MRVCAFTLRIECEEECRWRKYARALGWRGYLDVARSDVRIAPAVRIQEVEGPELVADTLALLLSNVLARLR